MNAKTMRNFKKTAATALAAALALYPMESVWAQTRSFAGDAVQSPVRPLARQSFSSAFPGANNTSLLSQTALSGASLGILSRNAFLPPSALQNSAALAAGPVAQVVQAAQVAAAAVPQPVAPNVPSSYTEKISLRAASAAQENSPAKLVGRETTQTRDALKDLPDLRQASAGAAFGAGIQLQDRITRRRSLSTSDDVAASLSLAASSRGLASLARFSGLSRYRASVDNMRPAQVPAPAKDNALFLFSAFGVAPLAFFSSWFKNDQTVSQFFSELPDKLSHITVGDAVQWGLIGLGSIVGLIIAVKLIRWGSRLVRWIFGKKTPSVRFKDAPTPSMASEEFLELLAQSLPADASVDEMAAAVSLAQTAAKPEPIALEKIQKFQKTTMAIASEMGKIIVGQKELILALIVAWIAGKHVMAEGVPGIAKTLIMRTFTSTIDGATFGRINGAPDMLPGDITGTRIIEEDLEGHRSFRDMKGPIFNNFVLFDEGNRTPPKGHATVLQAMEEHIVQIGETVYQLPKPFMLLWTQNPIEQEGTYTISEAQLDRFMFKIVLNEPDLEELVRIAELHTDDTKPIPVDKKATLADYAELSETAAKVRVDPALMRYAATLVFATRAPGLEELKTHSGEGLAGLKKYIKLGASPRAVLGLVRAAKIMALIHGRDYVLPEDIKRVAYNVLRHRLHLNHTSDKVTAEQLITKILDEVVIPGHEDTAAAQAQAAAPGQTAPARGWRSVAQFATALPLALIGAALLAAIPYAVVPLAGLGLLGVLAVYGFPAVVGLLSGAALHHALWSRFFPQDSSALARLKGLFTWKTLRLAGQFATVLPVALKGALLVGTIPYLVVSIPGSWLGILAISGIPAAVGLVAGVALHSVIWSKLFPKDTPMFARVKSLFTWDVLRVAGLFLTPLLFTVGGAALLAAIPYAVVPLAGLSSLGVLAIFGLPAAAGFAAGAALHKRIWGRYFPGDKAAAAKLSGIFTWKTLASLRPLWRWFSFLALILGGTLLFGAMPYMFAPAGLGLLGLVAIVGIPAAIGLMAGAALHNAVWGRFFPQDKLKWKNPKDLLAWRKAVSLRSAAKFATALPLVLGGAALFGAIPYVFAPAGLGLLGVLAVSGIPAMIGLAAGAALHKAVWGRFFPKEDASPKMDSAPIHPRF